MMKISREFIMEGFCKNWVVVSTGRCGMLTVRWKKNIKNKIDD